MKLVSMIGYAMFLQSIPIIAGDACSSASKLANTEAFFMQTHKEAQFSQLKRWFYQDLASKQLISPASAETIPKTVFRQLYRLAAAGHEEALQIRNALFDAGIINCVPYSLEVIQCLTEKAHAGNQEARYALAKLLVRDGEFYDWKLARLMLALAAYDGDAIAQRRFGRFLLRPKLGESAVSKQQEQEAISWLQKAGDQQDIHALRKLAAYYEKKSFRSVTHTSAPICSDLVLALHHAASRGNTEAIQDLIIEHKAAICDYKHARVSPDKKTALHRAAYAGHLDCVKVLLAADASPIMCDANGRSVLIYAICGKHKNPFSKPSEVYDAIIKALCDADKRIASSTFIDNQNASSLDYATFYNDEETARQLIACGADATMLMVKDPHECAARGVERAEIRNLLT